MDKKEKILNVLKRIYNDTSFVRDEEINQIVTLYEKQLEKDRSNYHISRDEENYTLTDEIRILKSVFEIIKNDDSLLFTERYKLEQYYEERLESILQTMYTEEMKLSFPKTPPVDSPNSHYIEKEDSQPTISYSMLPDYAVVLADMCADQMLNSQTLISESNAIKISLPCFEKYNKIASSLIGFSVGYHNDTRVSGESKKIATQTAIIISATENKNALIEHQRLEEEQRKREIEQINIQKEIDKIEIERLKIEQRLKTISSETLGSLFSKKILEDYPAEYQEFQLAKEQVKNYSHIDFSKDNLKERFSKAVEDLKFYQSILPVYESYYQIFEKIEKQREQQNSRKAEQERIYNLIYSAENEKLKNSHSLYTAWDLGNKTIPLEYQGMTYEQVAAVLNQKKAEEKVRQETQVNRDELIDHAIRKNLMISKDYHLSPIQIKNLSQKFAGYSNEQLKDFLTQGPKQETPVIKSQSTSNNNEFEKNLIRFMETKNSNLGKITEVMSVSGYPNSTYDVRFEDGEIHQITITQDEKKIIRSQTQNQKPIQEQPGMESIQPTQQPKVCATKDSELTIENNESEEKNRLIDDIISAMLNAGEFHNSGIDINRKMSDIEFVKRNLKEKSLEELQWALSIYNSQQEVISSEMHK